MEVHHQVRKALTSTERIEVLAAVAALDRLTAAFAEAEVAVKGTNS